MLERFLQFRNKSNLRRKSKTKSLENIKHFTTPGSNSYLRQQAFNSYLCFSYLSPTNIVRPTLSPNSGHKRRIDCFYGIDFRICLMRLFCNLKGHLIDNRCILFYTGYRLCFVAENTSKSSTLESFVQPFCQRESHL